MVCQPRPHARTCPPIGECPLSPHEHALFLHASAGMVHRSICLGRCGCEWSPSALSSAIGTGGGHAISRDHTLKGQHFAEFVLLLPLIRRQTESLQMHEKPPALPRAIE